MVARISIQAAHEQVNPSDLLHDVIYMDQNGIERCWSSDHYMPWWNKGASGGAAWPWLGAALARTNKITIGTGVTAPILRYHPAIVAQVFATLGFMFPNRKKYCSFQRHMILMISKMQLNQSDFGEDL